MTYDQILDAVSDAMNDTVANTINKTAGQLARFDTPAPANDRAAPIVSLKQALRRMAALRTS